MKALVYTGTETMMYRDEPEPEAGLNESLIRVDASGICGSDMHAYHGHDPRRVPPMILGHELAGVALSGPQQGKRVAINPMITCGVCRDCLAGNPNLCAERDLLGLGRAGGYAEQVVAPDANLIVLPDTLNTVHASLMEPAAVSVHSVRLAERVLLRPISECRCLVIGGGAIGLLAALVLANKGVRELWIAETGAARRQTLNSLGIAEVYNPLEGTQPNDAHFDLIVDAVGSGATRAASSRLARAGAVIAHVGLQNNDAGLDTRRLTLQEITWMGNYTYNQTDLRAAVDLLHRGALGDLSWVESRPLSEGGQAFRDIHNGSSSSPKIVLDPAG